MKIHSLLIAGIVTAFVALPASATEPASGHAARNYSPAAIHLAQGQPEWCVQHCVTGCTQRYPGKSAGYDDCMNKCQGIFCK